MAYTGISDLETSMATFYSHTLPKVVTVHICTQSMLLTQFPTLDAGSSDQSHYITLRALSRYSDETYFSFSGDDLRSGRDLDGAVWLPLLPGLS